MNPFRSFTNLLHTNPLHDALLEGANYVVQLSKLSTDLNRFAPSYPTLNPNFWARPLDYSGVSAHIDLASATLIGESGQFALTTSHWAKLVGATHEFVAESGTVYTKTVIDRRNIAGFDSGERDVTILKFAESDSELKKYRLPNPLWHLKPIIINKPAMIYTQTNIAAAKTWKSSGPFPNGADVSVTSTVFLSPLPSLYPTSRTRDISIQINNTFIPTGGSNTIFPQHDYVPISGDSGKPLFLVLGTDMILMAVFSTGASGQYYGHPRYLVEIPNLVTAMGGGAEQLFHPGF